VTSSTIANIIRKAATRRRDSAAKFVEASRRDLADKEIRECEILSDFLPPLLSETQIDSILGEIIKSLPAGSHPKTSLGQVFKEFQSKVEKSSVDVALVRRRAEMLLATST